MVPVMQAPTPHPTVTLLTDIAARFAAEAEGAGLLAPLFLLLSKIFARFIPALQHHLATTSAIHPAAPALPRMSAPAPPPPHRTRRYPGRPCARTRHRRAQRPAPSRSPAPCRPVRTRIGHPPARPRTHRPAQARPARRRNGLHATTPSHALIVPIT